MFSAIQIRYLFSWQYQNYEQTLCNKKTRDTATQYFLVRLQRLLQLH